MEVKTKNGVAVQCVFYSKAEDNSESIWADVEITPLKLIAVEKPAPLNNAASPKVSPTHQSVSITKKSYVILTSFLSVKHFCVRPLGDRHVERFNEMLQEVAAHCVTGTVLFLAYVTLNIWESSPRGPIGNVAVFRSALSRFTDPDKFSNFTRQMPR